VAQAFAVRCWRCVTGTIAPVIPPNGVAHQHGVPAAAVSFKEQLPMEVLHVLPVREETLASGCAIAD
jgi:hypothetical protein